MTSAAASVAPARASWCWPAGGWLASRAAVSATAAASVPSASGHCGARVGRPGADGAGQGPDEHEADRHAVQDGHAAGHRHAQPGERDGRRHHRQDHPGRQMAHGGAARPGRRGGAADGVIHHRSPRRHRVRPGRFRAQLLITGPR
jgi:hypothetical protein